MSVSHPSVVLQFARVTVHGSQGVTEATVMFDTGSDRSIVTQDLVNRVKPKWVDSEQVAFASFGSGKPSKTDLRHIFSVNLQDNHGTDQTLLATAVDVICAPLSRPGLGHDILTPLVTFPLQITMRPGLLSRLTYWWEWIYIGGCLFYPKCCAVR